MTGGIKPHLDWIPWERPPPRPRRPKHYLIWLVPVYGEPESGFPVMGVVDEDGRWNRWEFRSFTPVCYADIPRPEQAGAASVPQGENFALF